MTLKDLKYTLPDLMLAYDTFLGKDEFVYFWKHDESSTDVTKACLSQWYPCMFMENGIVYNCAEQYMMAGKARLFHDDEILCKILQASSPDVIKKLGKLVKNFDHDVWENVCIDIVLRGNLLKFTQNTRLRDFLLSTGKKTLAEASPYDKIWGIGMDEKTALTAYPHIWKGENRLGFVLMEVRDRIKEVYTKGHCES